MLKCKVRVSLKNVTFFLRRLAVRRRLEIDILVATPQVYRFQGGGVQQDFAKRMFGNPDSYYSRKSIPKIAFSRCRCTHFVKSAYRHINNLQITIHAKNTLCFSNEFRPLFRRSAIEQRMDSDNSHHRLKIVVPYAVCALTSRSVCMSAA